MTDVVFWADTVTDIHTGGSPGGMTHRAYIAVYFNGTGVRVQGDPDKVVAVLQQALTAACQARVEVLGPDLNHHAAALDRSGS